MTTGDQNGFKPPPHLLKHLSVTQAARLLPINEERLNMHDDDTGAAMEMPRYVSHKTVHALEIAEISLRDISSEDRRLSFRDHGYASIVAPGEMFTRYMPVSGDFYVVYADGYKSFSPRKAFLEGYTKAA